MKREVRFAGRLGRLGNGIFTEWMEIKKQKILGRVQTIGLGAGTAEAEDYGADCE